jgi:hypothetical protein
MRMRSGKRRTDAQDIAQRRVEGGAKAVVLVSCPGEKLNLFDECELKGNKNILQTKNLTGPSQHCRMSEVCVCVCVCMCVCVCVSRE